jgi:hypothetical protein
VVESGGAGRGTAAFTCIAAKTVNKEVTSKRKEFLGILYSFRN